jgi:hypothetical protein
MKQTSITAPAPNDRENYKLKSFGNELDLLVNKQKHCYILPNEANVQYSSKPVFTEQQPLKLNLAKTPVSGWSS